MINRLPLEYRAPAGALGSASNTSDPAGVKGIGGRLFGRAAACIGSYPTATLAAAFVAGLAIGRLVKT